MLVWFRQSSCLWESTNPTNVKHNTNILAKNFCQKVSVWGFQTMCELTSYCSSAPCRSFSRLSSCSMAACRSLSLARRSATSSCFSASVWDSALCCCRWICSSSSLFAASSSSRLGWKSQQWCSHFLFIHVLATLNSRKQCFRSNFFWDGVMWSAHYTIWIFLHKTMWEKTVLSELSCDCSHYTSCLCTNTTF